VNHAQAARATFKLHQYPAKTLIDFSFSEGSGENVFVVSNGIVMTPPLSSVGPAWYHA
jgi:branched-subunit amino acid aminotransferase/4-amino-4-deoxychorismate lyase